RSQERRPLRVPRRRRPGPGPWPAGEGVPPPETPLPVGGRGDRRCRPVDARGGRPLRRALGQPRSHPERYRGRVAVPPGPVSAAVALVGGGVVEGGGRVATQRAPRLVPHGGRRFPGPAQLRGVRCPGPPGHRGGVALPGVRSVGGPRVRLPGRLGGGADVRAPGSRGVTDLRPKLPAHAVATIHSFLRGHSLAPGLDGVVVGLSGGIDSALTARLARDALGPSHVLGLLLPDGGYPRALVEETEQYGRSLGIETRTMSIQPIVEAFQATLPSVNDRVALGNTKARIRMTLVYAIAREGRRLVAGAGNKSELLLGYFTKFGDGGVD